jgi:hypothetical protein
LIKGAYTRSKAIDMADDDGRVGLLFNYAPEIARNEAVAGYDIPNNFQIGGLYDLPFGKGKTYFQTGIASHILGGWEVNGTFSAYSGLPFTVTASGASLNAPNNTQTADQVLSTVALLGGIGAGNPYYDPDAFAPVTAVRYFWPQRPARSPDVQCERQSLPHISDQRANPSAVPGGIRQRFEYTALPGAQRECLFRKLPRYHQRQYGSAPISTWLETDILRQSRCAL